MKTRFLNIISSVFILFFISTHANSQTWTQVSTSDPLPNSTPITATGLIDVWVANGIFRLSCNVSFDGTVTSSDRITFHQNTPGFFSNCEDDGLGLVDFPFDMRAEFGGGSPTGDRATIPIITINTPIGPCSGSGISFTWYDATLSQATLSTIFSAPPICTVRPGSFLKLKESFWTSGNIDIR